MYDRFCCMPTCLLTNNNSPVCLHLPVHARWEPVHKYQGRKQISSYKVDSKHSYLHNHVRKRWLRCVERLIFQLWHYRDTALLLHIHYAQRHIPFPCISPGNTGLMDPATSVHNITVTFSVIYQKFKQFCLINNNKCRRKTRDDTTYARSQQLHKDISLLNLLDWKQIRLA